ncbi:MAG: glycosyltransferase 87 family protein [Anaerolineales bacterium]
MTRRNFLLLLLGAASVLPYAAALGLGDLRKHTPGFEVAYFGAFALYLVACALVLRMHHASSFGKLGASRFTLFVIAAFAIVFRLILLPSSPTLSDDMFRYVWDGRVQAQGLSPYQYPPNAQELIELRQPVYGQYWKFINRKESVTVYPPGAQLAYAGLWRVVGDSVLGYKAAFVLAELLGAVLLMQLLKHFNQPPERVLIYLWSPLLIFEVAHAGHVDGLMLPLLIAAFWARVKDRHILLGVCLGAATAVKFFPALLLPALLPISWKDLRPALRTAAIFVATLALTYVPYLFTGPAIGFLPKYFDENFNLGLARTAFEVADYFGWQRALTVNVVTFGGLAVMGLAFTIRPAADARAALLRCVWLIGWFTLTTQNLFPWYLLWLLPLIALFVEPGKLFGFKLAPMTAWLVYSGTVMFAYVFFVRWRVIPLAQAAEYWPLYGLLIAAGVARLLKRERQASHEPVSAIA